MIITSQENIPGKRIVEIIGPVYAKSFQWSTEQRAVRSVLEKLEAQALKLGADAIIGYKLIRGLTSFAAYGTAVRIEDVYTTTVEQSGQRSCPQCKSKLPEAARFCPSCGSKIS